nr:sigma-70 family RNA polymerase sigma factor [uncultured Albidiferax sp.]
MPPSLYADTDAEDILLVRQVAAADRAALAGLYRGYHRRLSRFLSRLTRRNDLIEEVINDCFWIVWQKAAEFRGESRVSTWIMGIAYRCTLKALRQEGGLDTVDDGEPRLAHESTDPQADRELRNWLDKGLEHLNAEQALTLDLAYGSGHSLEEISAIMQCPVSTVKARMFHARVKLRNLLPTLATPHAGRTGDGAIV